MNSIPNSAQHSTLHQVRSCALRAHSVRSCAHNAEVAAHTRLWSRAQRPGHGHKLPILVATPRLDRNLVFPCPALGQVATSFSGHDLLDDQARSRCQSSRRDLLSAQQRQTRSRCQSPRRDLLLAQQIQTRSQPQNGVATPFSNKPGHDLNIGL